MAAGASSFPTRRNLSYIYMPITALISLIFIIIGLGLWVHYTTVMYQSAEDATKILGITVNSSAGKVTRVKSGLVATSVLFCIFSAAIMAFGTWKGVVQLDQDQNGRLYAHMQYFLYGNLVLQFIWAIIMIWLVLMMMGDAVFAGWVYVVKEALLSCTETQAAVAASLDLQASMPSTINAYNCPATCFNANGFGILVDVKHPSFLENNCVCDTGSIKAAYSVLSTASNAVGGMLVGIWFMYVSGVVLCYYLSAMLAQIRTWVDFNERLLGIAN